MLVVLLLLPLSLAMNDGEFDNGGGPAGAAAVGAVDKRDGGQWRRWRGRLMAAASFDGISKGATMEYRSGVG